jgi:hypothetical protein
MLTQKMVIKGTAHQLEIQNIQKESIHMYTGMERFIDHFSNFLRILRYLQQ